MSLSERSLWAELWALLGYVTSITMTPFIKHRYSALNVGSHETLTAVSLMRNLRLREVKSVAQGHTAGKWQNPNEVCLSASSVYPQSPEQCSVEMGLADGGPVLGELLSKRGLSFTAEHGFVACRVYRNSGSRWEPRDTKDFTFCFSGRGPSSQVRVQK